MQSFEQETAPENEARPGNKQLPYTVLQLVRGTNRVLENTVGTFWVEGEITAITKAASGHCYFSLADDGASIRAAMWRSDARRLKFELKGGERIRCRGRLGVYERDGKMQMYVQTAEPAGLGDDALALAMLKEKLAKEGLFGPERKRPLPFLPRRIGVVTSETGAAVRDIIKTVDRRFAVSILVSPALVQGDLAPVQIARAIERLQDTDCDVIIVGRGGGSAQDLSAFNAEIVVRAVAASKIPTISAVGHEVDMSLTDLAADKRAATPTMAGEMAVPVKSELRALIDAEENRLRREMLSMLRQARQGLDLSTSRCARSFSASLATYSKGLMSLEHRLSQLHPRAQIAEHRAALVSLGSRLNGGVDRALAERQRRYREATARLDALSPLRVLGRGYALASRGETLIRSAEVLTTGDALSVRFAEGSVACTVDRVFPEPDSGGKKIGSVRSSETAAFGSAGAKEAQEHSKSDR